MSLSSQSQEALTSIENELKDILRRSTNVRVREGNSTTPSSSQESNDASHKKEDSETESESEIHTEDEDELERKSKRKKTSKGKSTGSTKGKKRGLDETKDNQIDSSSPTDSNKRNQKQKLSASSPDVNKGSPQRPMMQRTKSLEAIGKHQPTQVIKVCLEKTTQLLQSTEAKDYKKIKYWLKIAQNMSSQISRLNEFHDFLKSAKEQNSTDKELAKLLDNLLTS